MSLVLKRNKENSVSVREAQTLAERAAQEMGAAQERNQCVVTETSEGWRFSFFPHDYIERRGGDVIIDVSPRGEILRRLRGQ